MDDSMGMDEPLMARWREASRLQQEINGLGFGDPKDREINRLRAEIARLRRHSSADAVQEYIQLRGLAPDWQPDYGSQEWNWFKIGWDAHVLALAALDKEQ